MALHESKFGILPPSCRHLILHADGMCHFAEHAKVIESILVSNARIIVASKFFRGEKVFHIFISLVNYTPARFLVRCVVVTCNLCHGVCMEYDVSGRTDGTTCARPLQAALAAPNSESFPADVEIEKDFNHLSAEKHDPGVERCPTSGCRPHAGAFLAYASTGSQCASLDVCLYLHVGSGLGAHTAGRRE